MHRGPFAEEFDTLARLAAFAETYGRRAADRTTKLHIDGFTGETPQDTLRTILRDPSA